jgi:hypothetical protein
MRLEGEGFEPSVLRKRDLLFKVYSPDGSVNGIVFPLWLSRISLMSSILIEDAGAS